MVQTRAKANQRNYIGSWIVTLPHAEAIRAAVGESRPTEPFASASPRRHERRACLCVS